MKCFRLSYNSTMLNSRSPALTDPLRHTQPAHPCFVLNCLIFKGKTKQGKAVCLPERTGIRSNKKAKPAHEKPNPVLLFSCPWCIVLCPLPPVSQGQSLRQQGASQLFNGAIFQCPKPLWMLIFCEIKSCRTWQTLHFTSQKIERCFFLLTEKNNW